tara:strand:+ start:1351 stop:2070 length:720 start_codon:yes stop_codon:yes gene_type:complete
VTTAITTAYLTVDGLNLSVKIAGAGRPFLFLHGLCGDALQPLEVFPDDAGWQCHALEGRGHGGSDIGNMEELSIRRLTEDAAAYLESLGRPAWVDQPAPENLEPHRHIARNLGQYGPEKARRIFEESVMAKTIAAAAPDNMNSYQGFFDRRPTDQTQALLAAIANDGPGVCLDAMSRIMVPALVIGTGRDLAHPLDMAKALAAQIPRAELVEITPKSYNRKAYVREFRNAVGGFLREVL